MIEIHTDNSIPQIMSSGSVGWISERHITHGGCYGNFPGHRTDILIAQAKPSSIGTCTLYVRILRRCGIRSWECLNLKKRDLCAAFVPFWVSRETHGNQSFVQNNESSHF